jgi:hypothetical protein
MSESDLETKLDEAARAILEKIKSRERLRVWTLIELDMMIPQEHKPRIKSLFIKEEDEQPIL